MIYVMSDLHGNLRRFYSVMEQIALGPEDTLLVLGDVIDRHPGGIKLLRTIMDMPNAKMLLGNHEYMMLRALGEPYDGPEDIAGLDPERLTALWYRNGGGVTHRAWKHTRKTVRADILDFLKALPLNIDVEAGGRKFKLVHAAPVELYDPANSEKVETLTHFAVWDRRAVLSVLGGAYTVVFGHTPTMSFQEGVSPLTVFKSGDIIGIDCGSGFEDPAEGEPIPEVQGRLACLRLDDLREFYSEERKGATGQRP